MRLIPILASLALGGATIADPAGAGEHNRPADIAIACNAHGAVVTLGPGTDEPGAVYYLGRTCDAYRPDLGTGRWWYAASAFVIELGGQSRRFANDLSCPALPFCRFE